MKTNYWQLRPGLRSYRVHCKSKPLFTKMSKKMQILLWMTKLWFDYMAHSLLILSYNGFSVLILNVLGVWPPCESELCD